MLTYEVVQDKNNPADWRVEACNVEGDGECYVTIFAGPMAANRAIEYAHWVGGDEGRSDGNG